MRLVRPVYVSPWGSRQYQFGPVEVYLVKRPCARRFTKLTVRLGRRMLELSW